MEARRCGRVERARWVGAKRGMARIVLVGMLAASIGGGCRPTNPPASATGPSAAPPKVSVQGRALGVAPVIPSGPALGRGRQSAKGAGLKVRFHSPSGKAEDVTAVLVTFSEPMASLTTFGAKRTGQGGFPLEIQPEAVAEQRWLSGDTAKLAFRKPLRFSTRYRVTVRRDATSLLGHRLGKPFSWTFETARVEISDYRIEGPGLVGRKSVRILFNQSVSLGEVRRKMPVSVDGRPWPVTWRRPDRPTPNQVLLVPSRPWPKGGHKVSIRLPRGFHGSEGPLPTAKAQELGLRTVGPLRISLWCQGNEVEKGRSCWPVANEVVRGLEIRTSEPVERRALLSALKIRPSVGNLAKVIRVDANLCEDEGGNRVCGRSWLLKVPLRPATVYRVSVSARLRDIHGEKLEKPFGTQVRTRRFPPGLFLSRSPSGYARPGSKMQFSWVSGRVIMRQWHAADGASVVRLARCLAQKKAAPALACLNHLVSRTDERAAKAGRVTKSSLVLPQGLSLISFQLRPDREFRSFYPRSTDWPAGWRLVQATDLSVHVRATPLGLMAWVTDMPSGKGLAGAKVALWDEKGRLLGRARTDGLGVARIAMTLENRDWRAYPKRGFLVQASLGPRKAFVFLGAWDRLWTAFPTDWMAHRQGDWLGWRSVSQRRRKTSSFVAGWTGDLLVHRGWIGTERGVYRPGEPVYVQGAVRAFRAWRPERLKIRRAELVLQGPFGKAVLRRAVRIGPMGAFETSIPLPTTGRLGLYTLSLVVEGKTLVRKWFKVAHFRPPRFWVRLSVPRVLGPGRDIPIRAEARTYAGSAMDSAPLHLTVRSQRSDYSFQGVEYRAGRLDWVSRPKTKTWYQRDELLDREGRFFGKIPFARTKAAWQKEHFPLAHDITVEAMSPAGRTVSRFRAVVQWPADRIVGLRRIDDAPRTTFELGVFDPEERHLSGRVVCELFPVVDPKDRAFVDWSKPLWMRRIQVPKTGVRFIPSWPKGYKGAAVLRFSVKDAAGRVAWTTTTLEPPRSGAGQTASHGHPRHGVSRKRASLKIELPNRSYKFGQSARITVRRKGKVSDGILVVERERIFDVLPIRFHGNKQVVITLPVRDPYGPAVFVTALATAPLRIHRGVIRRLLAAGARVDVDLDEYELNLKIRADKKVYGPGDKVRIQAQVTDAQGHPVQAALVLTAVDESVLALAGSGRWSPVRDLLNEPFNQVEGYDLRLKPFDERVRVLMIPPGMGFGIGGGRGAGGGYGLGGLGTLNLRGKPGLRRSFVTTPWQTMLVTDARGRARAEFTLPDNLTTFAILGFGVDQGRRSGLGRTSVKVTLPLAAFANLPRQVRVGDSFQPGVTIYNQSGKPVQARVSIRARGHVSLKGATTKQIRVPAKGSASVRFRAGAEGPGQPNLSFRVCGGGRCDALERSLAVTVPTVVRAMSVAGSTTKPVAHRVGPLSDLLPDKGGLDVQLSSSMLVGLGPGVSSLLSYPYDCTEQSASKLLGMLAWKAILPRDDNTKNAKVHVTEAAIQKRVGQLLARRNRDGGFAFWPGGSSSVWATSYALIVLHRAGQEHLARVPKWVFADGKKYLEDRLSLLVLIAQERAGAKLRTKSRTTRRASHGAKMATTIGSKPGVKPRPKAAERRRRAARERWERLHIGPRAVTLAALALSRLGAKPFAMALARAQHRLGDDETLAQKAMLLAATAGAAKTAAERKIQAEWLRRIESRIKAEGLSAHVERSGQSSWWPFDSLVRDTALVLMALVAAKPDHPMADRLARWLVLDRKSAEFRTTQEAAWSLMALWDLSKTRKEGQSAFWGGVWMGRSLLGSLSVTKGQRRARHVVLPMKQLLARVSKGVHRLVVGVRGKGRLYYTLRLRYAAKTLPRRALDHGLTIRRHVQTLDRSGKILSRRPRFGDQVLVTLEVESSEVRRFVVVEDPLPGGLEAVDFGLRTATKTWGLLRHLAKNSWFDHQELRDDRVLFFRDTMPPGKLRYSYLARVTTPGRFVWPPAKAEEMYEPGTFGTGPATWVVFP